MSRVVVITGASAGVGRAAAVAFGRQGDRVALIARGQDGLNAAAAEVRGAGGQALDQLRRRRRRGGRARRGTHRGRARGPSTCG